MPASRTPSRRQVLDWAAAASVVGTLPFASRVWAQGKYPDKPVKLIVALPAGGSVDMVARALGDKLKAALGGTWIVDNRPGGSGQIGMPAVARSPADGYSLTVWMSSTAPSPRPSIPSFAAGWLKAVSRWPPVRLRNCRP
jgi:tripartite-type tricarboxylate transporter receptor subunit TctC